MDAKTIRLAHPELCDGCSDLLQSGTVVLVDGSLHVSCAACAGDVAGLPSLDPWAFVTSRDLHDQLVHRHDVDHRQLIPA